MFDSIQIEAYVPQSLQPKLPDRETGNIEFRGICLIPVKSIKTHEVQYYQGEERNLRVKYDYRSGKVSVSNSIHKFAKGNNYSDLSYSELESSLRRITMKIGISLKEWSVKKYEIGFNIETERKGVDYLNIFYLFKTKYADKMRKDAFWYGLKWYLTEYEVKIYDKTEEVKRHDRIKLDSNILRFEVNIKKSRKTKIIQYASDLLDTIKLDELFRFFISQMKLIKTIENIDPSLVSKQRDVEMFFAGLDSSYWKYQHQTNPLGIADKRRRYNRILAEISTKDTMDCFLRKLEEKYRLFITS